MTINRDTAAGGGSQQHTGTQFRVAGFGPKAANIASGSPTIDLNFTIASALNLKTAPKAAH